MIDLTIRRSRANIAPLSVRRAALSVLVLLALVPGRIDGQQRSRILLSNDDGIGSEGIAAMAAALREFADVVVVAPAENQSGSSHETVIRTQITTVRPFYRDGELFGYGIGATPADAVKFGLLRFGLEQPFDLVVSGINDGANVGWVAHTSGTVGAAMEALLNGLPSVAVSQGNRDEFEVSARFAAGVVREVLERGLPAGTMLSINIPAGELEGVRVAPMGGLYFRVSAVEETRTAGDSTQYRARVTGAYEVQPGSDTRAYLDRFVTVTPLRIDWTDEAMLRDLATWQLRLEN